MEKTNNPLIEAIKNETTADEYLSDVSAKDFIQHVTDLIKQNCMPVVIKQAINELQKFI